MGSHRHLLTRNPNLHGFEYGALRDFEEAILRVTHATELWLERPRFPAAIERRALHGARYGHLRRFLPKTRLAIEADALWVILMGPEGLQLDLFRDWQEKTRFKILYIFDTFPSQVRLVKRILSVAEWDLCITSFADAVPLLERQTGRKWFCVPQGVNLERFRPAALEDRSIAVSAYGRRLDHAHRAVLEFCRERNLYYDYSSGAALSPGVTATEAYEQYAWHMSHSMLNFSWPVEITHPARAGGLSPLTCRWFEAAASGCAMVGKPPRDRLFEDLFGTSAICEIDPDSSTEALKNTLNLLWNRRKELHEMALSRYQLKRDRWSWESRVHAILDLAAINISNSKTT